MKDTSVNVFPCYSWTPSSFYPKLREKHSIYNFVMDWKFCWNFMSKSYYETFCDRNVKRRCVTTAPQQEQSFLVKYSSLSAQETEEKFNLWFWFAFYSQYTRVYCSPLSKEYYLKPGTQHLE